MTSDTLRVGVIGAGGNTKLHHLPKLAAIPGVTVVAVSNRTKESAGRVAAEFGIPKATDNWLEIIEDPEIDAIVIGTWPNMHRTLVLAALRANKHVLCEARLAMNASEAREMLEESQKRPHLTTQVVPSPITFPYDAKVAGILKSGVLGNLIYIEVKSVGGFGGPAFPEANGSPLTWRQDVNLSGLNIMTLGIYYEALQRWIGDVSSVFALSKTVVNVRRDASTGEAKAVHIPDHLDVLATHPSGANVHFLVTNVLGHSSGLTSGFVLHGSSGTLQLDLGNHKLSLAIKGDGVKDVPVPEEETGRWRVEEEFVGAIRGQNKVTTTDFVKGFHYMQFTEAVTRSLQSRKVVPLPLLQQ